MCSNSIFLPLAELYGARRSFSNLVVVLSKLKLKVRIVQPPSETPHSERIAQDIETCESGLTYVEKPHEKDGSTFIPLGGLRGVVFWIKDGHFSLGFQTGRTSGLAGNSNH